MRLVSEAREKTGKDLYAEKYEFRWCTGSIEPDDEQETFGRLIQPQDADRQSSK